MSPSPNSSLQKIPNTQLEKKMKLFIEDIDDSINFIKNSGFEHEETIDSLEDLVESGTNLIQEGLDLFNEGTLDEIPIIGTFFVGFLGELPLANFVVKPILHTQKIISKRKLKASIKQSQKSISVLKGITRAQSMAINKINKNINEIKSLLPEIEIIFANNFRNMLIMYTCLFFLTLFISVTYRITRRNSDEINKTQEKVSKIEKEVEDIKKNQKKEMLIYTVKSGDRLWTIAEKCYQTENHKDTSEIVEFITRNNPPLQKNKDRLLIGQKINLRKGNYTLKEFSCN